ncbi:aquaporin-like protein [Tilletiaria anomala UBC 951]|uniref:Aquaporin-like protein n=1 Tax=Tilletiaria anomala (strain ATCC 24038 / CBS 436.72 / UBC 951) TaxID=1037660 RepID=A0A066VG85_TILAU|nr:aquaporin-like protein [Tilletiaria anomala UBC 951]KDN37595.1 aquaporin-like protein [Tilletiaria anomala UBC 951]
MSNIHATYHTAEELSEKSSSGAQEVANDQQQQHHHAFQRPHRQAGQMELGLASIVQDRESPRSVVPAAGLSDMEFRKRWEQWRPELLVACVGEILGVIFYVSFGGFSLATLIVTTYAGSPQGSLLNVALSYALGIAFAVIIAAPLSGSHLNPCVTISLWLYKGFPAWKIPIYIMCQLLGGLLGGFLVVACWHDELLAIAAELTAKGKEAVIYSASGPAGVIALFPTPGRSYGAIFATEFIADFLIGLVIATHLDSSNPFVSPVSAPIMIGLAYFAMIVGLASGDLATNTARDLPTRMVCAAFFDPRQCFPPRYSALTALTNILATLLAFGMQTFLLSDTRRPPAPVAHHFLLEEEKRKHDLHVKTHEDMLDRRIQKVISRGGDPSALEAKRTISRMP